MLWGTAEAETTTESNIQGWYALYTRHQHEKTVTRLLLGKGFETFLPLYAAVHRSKNGVKELSLPLFSCYVFLRGPVERWLPVLMGTRWNFVSQDSKPAFTGNPSTGKDQLPEVCLR